MKIKLMMTAVFIAGVMSSKACDVCGGSSNMFGGMLPQYQKQMLTLSQQYTHFQHPSTAANMFDGNFVKNDHFYQSQLDLRMQPKPYFQWLMSATYKSNIREVENQNSIEVKGMGDLQMGGYFIPLNALDSSDDHWRQFVRIGGVITLPTAKYQQRYSDLTMMPVNLQLGFGAYLFRPELNYVYRKRNWGLNTQIKLQMVTENEMGFKLGRSSLLNGSVFYNPSIRGTNLILNLGIGHEEVKQATEYGYAIEQDLSLTRTSLNASVDVFLNRHVLGLQTTYPLRQKNATEQPDLKQVIGLRWNWFW